MGTLIAATCQGFLNFHVLPPVDAAVRSLKDLPAVLVLILPAAFPASTAYAAIDNVARAAGTHEGTTVETPDAPAAVDVEPAVATLSATATGVLDVSGGEDSDAADAGDRVIVSVSVRNEGNVSVTGVQAAAIFSIDGVAATGTLSEFDPSSAAIEPGAAQEFTASFTLSAADVFRSAGREDGILATASAAGDGPSGAVAADASASVAVMANPRLSLTKEATLAKADGNSGTGAETGDTISYVYTVSNIGNVAITAVTISDLHEGSTLLSAEAGGVETGPWNETELKADVLELNDDTSGTNGSWDVLGAGGAITFTYNHTVTQAEFEAQ
ncbi:DUF7507 domain-containing protein [Oricola cellulosilytica]|nr:hypothetical protein [Oricola cellulosilytica]